VRKPTREEYPELSDAQLDAIERSAVAADSYINSVGAVRILAWWARLMDGFPVLGRIILGFLDEAVRRMRSEWSVVVETTFAVPLDLNDPRFVRFAVNQIRQEIDRDWPAPRPIRLPSDPEAAHGPGDC
jgi:hypothetical protein